MANRLSSKRGFWDGLSVDLVKPGLSCDNAKISPNGEHLSFTLSMKGNKLFNSNINGNSINNIREVTPHSLSTGTPYGGGLYCWSSDSEKIFFSSDGKLFSLSLETDSSAEIIFDRKDHLAYAPFASKNFLIFPVEQKKTMSLGLLNLRNHKSSPTWPQQLNYFANFIYDPQISPDEKNVLIHSWNFPNMSWNGSEISLIPLEELQGDISNLRNYQEYSIAGSNTVATSQPRFSPDGKFISYLSEKTGWLNLWIANNDGSEARPIVEESVEHSYSTWVTGGSSYTWLPNSREILFCRNNHGFFSLNRFKIDTGEITKLRLEKGVLANIQTSKNPEKSSISVLFSNYKTKSQICLLNPFSDHTESILNPIFSSTPYINLETKKSLVEPEIISFPTSDNSKSHGLLYLKDDGEGKKENAPCIIFVHGGPTGMSVNQFSGIIQYLALRGYAVFAVNHRGSIGYGKEYREILNGNWGVYDVNDSADALSYLSGKGYIDKRRSCIMGGSAGGFTVLMSLVKKPGFYSAGVDLFGVSDNFGLAEDTHYLESRYSDSLVGPLPEASDKYIETSAIYHADKIADPLIIFQGADDKVVPKDQSEKIKSNVKGYVEYHVYEGEGHGFMKPETLEHMYPVLDKFLRKYVLYGIKT